MDAEVTGGLGQCMFTWQQIHQDSDSSLDSTAVLQDALPKLIASLTFQQNVLGCVLGTNGCTKRMYNLWI